MNADIHLEHRAGSSQGKHEGEPSLGLCDRLNRTRDNSQRQLPTDHDYAVPTREYQTDQSSLKIAPTAARSVFGKGKQRQRQKQPHCCAELTRSLHIRPIHSSTGIRACRHVPIASGWSVEPEILEPAEIAAILAELKGIEPVRTAFLIAAVMGMRRGEIFGLKWADLDFEGAILHVRCSFVDGVEGLPKTESSRRPLPVPPQALDALKVWKEKAAHTAPVDWVFASKVSFGKQPLWPGTFWRRNVAPAIERAGITKPKLGWHTLRRSYASLLFFTGASLRVSMELMRHSTPEMTLGTYAQTVGDEKRNAGEKVALLVVEGGKAA